MSSSSYVDGVGGGPARDYGDFFQLPAAPAQRQLWFLCQLDESANAAYNVVSAVRLTGRLNPVLLQRALNVVVARHESLRTGIGLVDGDLRQLVVPETLVSLPLVDRSVLAPAAAEVSVQSLAREQAAIPFTLDEPPLLRVLLVREAPERHTLIVVIHHIACDGWSTEVFYRDLADGYQRLVDGRLDARPELPIQYADYVAWQQESLAGERMRDLVAHWRGVLSGVTPLALPVDRPRGTRRMVGARLEVPLDVGELEDLDGLTTGWGATRFMVLLAAFKLTLARATGQDDVAVGTPVAGRHHPDAEDLIGFFANTLVLRTRLPLGEGFGAAVAAVRHTCLEAFSHQQMPFDRLVEEVRQTRLLDRNPLFDVMFSVQDTPAVTLELPGLTMSPVELTTTSAKFDLWLTVLPGGLLRLDYDSDLYDAGTAQRILVMYRSVLAEVRRHPDVACAGLPRIDPAEHALVESWSAGPPLPPQPSILASLATRDPETVAVQAEDGELTHGELRRRAADLAGLLRAEGIAGPGVTVTTPPVASAALVAIAVAVLEIGAVLRYGDRHERAGAFIKSAVDGWVITTGPRFDPVADPEPSTPDSPAFATFTRRDLATAIAAVAERLGITPADDVVLLAGDVPSPVDLLLPLVTARRLVLAGDPPPSSVVVASLATWRGLLTEGWTPPEGARLVCRGETVAPDLAEMLTATGCTVYFGRESAVSATPLGLSTSTHLGPPLAGSTRQLLDGTGAPVPVGITGELYHNGASTGERYRYTRDGELIFVGYTDERVVSGDHVVLPSRVERALVEQDGVREAAVVADGGDLVGWLVPENPREREEFILAVQAAARQVLAPHEVPTLFGVLPELPRLGGGAVDRAGLTALRGLARLGAVDDTPPRNRLERVVIAIFRDLLPVRDFGVHADFFALGGHSLLAAKVIGRVRDQEGVLVPVRDFFRRATAAGLAEAVAAQAKDKPAALHGQLAQMTDTEVEQLLRQLG
jgi:non-ribosomal peptide synthetase component F